MAKRYYHFAILLFYYFTFPRLFYREFRNKHAGIVGEPDHINSFGKPADINLPGVIGREIIERFVIHEMTANVGNPYLEFGLRSFDRQHEQTVNRVGIYRDLGMEPVVDETGTYHHLDEG